MMNASVQAALNSICIVIPYFGKRPVWMPYYLETCRFNNTIHWVFYTDCGTPQNLPPNVKIIDISYTDYCDLVSRKLEINFHPENPYKLCDIKPLLGFIHEDILHGYDFWGFGDIDLVYGDLRAYFSKTRLARKDLFATHARRISGHLCLIRNTDEMRTAFRRVRNWKYLISKLEHVAFDEKAFSKIFLRHKNSPKIVRLLAGLFDPWLRKAEFIEAYTTPNAKLAWIDGSKIYPSTWYWQDGLVTNDIDGDKTYPYFHFMVWKNNWQHSDFELKAVASTSHSFLITNTGIKYTEKIADQAEQKFKLR
jgi:hypothetical protein